ncbi:m106L [Myxoma virus]|nr:m106L [Myxoma virus]AQT34766.1 m106L [Myxoma virus]AQT34936.1 m106L [Myxoma virus]AQT35106.1 m106L [Myxoma virus]AQT35276.1 m106L [Myxoma virus]
MGGYVSVTDIKVRNDPGDYNKKQMFINFNYPEYNKVVSFYEDENIYRKEESEIHPKFCLTETMDPSHCGTFLSDELSKKYVLTRGEPCRSFTFRPGSFIIYNGDINERYIDNQIPDSAKAYIAKGYRCRFVKKDYMIMDKEIEGCCTSPHAGCPGHLNNGYVTSHCDTYMDPFCTANPGNSQCLTWLRTKRKIALETYSQICATEMEERYCSEFVRVARPDYFTFADNALIKFCDRNKANKNCWCVTSPSKTITDEKYLGPRVCWLHECTDKSKDRKWLLFDQDVQRSRCKYTGCSINVNELTLENSNADLVAECKGLKTVTGDIDPGVPKKPPPPKRPFFFSFVISFICIAVLFYFVAVFYRKKIKTRDINVRRR